MPPTDATRGPAWPFVLAGLAALIVAVVRTIAGANADLAPIIEALGDNPLRAVIYINWYALSGILAMLAVSLLWAARRSRPARLATAIIATLSFALVAAMFMGFTWAETGSPFTFLPWIPLTVTTALSAFAAWKA